MLPQKLPWELAMTQWAQQLNPIIADPLTNHIILQNVQVLAGSNVINHKLGRKLQGWFTVRVRSNATFFDTQDTNQTPQLTLNLTASADSVIDLVVF